LHNYLDSLAATEHVPEWQRLRITSLGAPDTTTVVHGPAITAGLVVAGLLFLGACALILYIPAIIREWRAASKEPDTVAVLERGASPGWTQRFHHPPMVNEGEPQEENETVRLANKANG
jgi:hypothetical protein